MRSLRPAHFTRMGKILRYDGVKEGPSVLVSYRSIRAGFGNRRPSNKYLGVICHMPVVYIQSPRRFPSSIFIPMCEINQTRSYVVRSLFAGLPLLYHQHPISNVKTSLIACSALGGPVGHKGRASEGVWSSGPAYMGRTGELYLSPGLPRGALQPRAAVSGV